MRLLFAILFLWLSVASIAQLREVEIARLNELLFEKINALRQKQNVKPLEADSSLMQAASFHSVYMSRYGRLSHQQKSRKNKTPKNRVERYSDAFEMVGENILFVHEKKKRIAPDRLVEIAQEMFQGWKDSPGHYANMINSDFEYGGLGFARSKSGKLYATHVFGKKGIKIPGQLSKKAFHIKSGVKYCRGLLEGKENLVVNMGNALDIEDGKVVLRHHNVASVQEILVGERDGVAVDLVTSDQFCCGKENHLDMSEIYDGVLLKPVYKAQLLAQNRAESEYRLIADLGTVPSHLEGKGVVPNLIVIKEGKKCAYTVPQYIPRSDYQLIATAPRLLKPDVPLRTTGVMGTEEIQFDFERGITTPSFTTTLKTKTDAIARLEIYANSSIEGDSMANARLHQKRADYIQQYVARYTGQHAIRPIIHARENWEMLDYQLDLHGLKQLKTKSKAEMRQWVVRDTTVNWDSLLHVQRRSYACIQYRGSWKSSDPLHAYRNLRTALLHNDFKWANKALAEMCQSDVEAGLLLDQSLLKHFLSCVELVQNASAILALGHADTEVKVLFLRQWLNRSAQLSPDAIFNLLILYNETVYELLNRWDVRSAILAKVVHPYIVKQLMEQIEVDSEELLLNYHLASIKYFGQLNHQEGIVTAFNFITGYFENRLLDLDDEIMLCLFFNLWSRYDLTVARLYQHINEPDFNEQAAFILVRTAMAYPYPFNDEQLFEMHQKAFEFNPSKWCLWLKINFQLMRYPQIKEMYCKACEQTDIVD